MGKQYLSKRQTEWARSAVRVIKRGTQEFLLLPAEQSLLVYDVFIGKRRHATVGKEHPVECLRCRVTVVH